MTELKRYELTVSPKVAFLPEQSDPDKNHFVFAYTITVTNTGTVAAQLVSRHWIITDA
jgi:ApaG protein